MGASWRCALALAGAALLAGCGSSDSASYLIDGTGAHALTLIRDRSYAWSDAWNLVLVVVNDPECQRRHELKPGGGNDNFKVEVYRAGAGAYILRQGKRWYVTDTAKCQLQQFKEPPPEPGELIGTFVTRGEPLHFAAASPGQAAQAGGEPR
jgi:hypothetical protein